MIITIYYNIDCIFVLFSIIAKTLNDSKKLYCVFIDYEKAFDKIDRIKLWTKLLQENVSSKIVLSLKAMYSTVKCCVKYNNLRSDWFESGTGLKQGCPSSSLLFLFFVNDVTSNINTNLEGIFKINDIKIFLLMFADDAALCSHNPNSLQLMLNDLQEYCNTWGLTININKTKAMIFEKGRHTTKQFYLNNSEI